MPYISQEARRQLALEERNVFDPGELNYMFTGLIAQYIKTNGESYQTYNDVMGALEGAKLELYRRKIAPYEDTKIEKNGDVYL